ncbi:STAS domain-containing protein [Pseudoxanthomonas sp. 22568]|uniref:STAS domain-containing protein n=1 Tax=unclassified Pseudoxanthomonas TaxID=2645906 RepID=UPI00178079C4|nr:STAS domain-containing protein [Pseudoxanthomonas sp. PXM04]MBD9378644.1 STAS domain-containing protein [Pseudoxanthomonas sp. PXM04]UBB25428.1 STAS domain-containing protein [Pseudoxanthomonas japonensis]
MSLEITLLPPGQGSQRVVVAGRLDTHTYEDLDEALAPLMTTQLHSLVLDLSQLEYISSAGIRSIFKARKTLAAHGGKVLVVNPQPQIQKVFDVVKAVPLNDIFGSTAEADAYLDAMQRKVLQGDDSD